MSDDPVTEGGQSEAEERFNLQLRKFLKQVGITSQREIERAAADLGSGSLNVRVHLSGDGGLDHTVEGRIDLP